MEIMVEQPPLPSLYTNCNCCFLQTAEPISTETHLDASVVIASGVVYIIDKALRPLDYDH